MEFQCLLLAFVYKTSTSMQLDEQHGQLLQESSLQRESSFDQSLAKRPRLDNSLEDECLQKRSDEHMQMLDILSCDNQDKIMQNNLLYNEIEEMIDNFSIETEVCNSQNESENIGCQLPCETKSDHLSFNDTYNITGDSFSTQTFEACCPYKQTNFSTQSNPEVSIDHCLVGLDNIKPITSNEKCQNSTDVTDQNTLCCVNTEIDDTTVDQMLNSIAEMPYKEFVNIIEDMIIAVSSTNNDAIETRKETCTTAESVYIEISRIVDAAKSGVSFISLERFNEKTNILHNYANQQCLHIEESAQATSKDLKELFYKRLDILKQDRTDLVHKCKIDINPKMRDELVDLIRKLSQESEHSPDEISNSQFSAKTPKKVFDMCTDIERFNLESFSTETIQLLYLALTTHLCFDYKPSIACYVLKDGLWGIHVYMSEFYFYLIWKLQRLNNEYVHYQKYETSYKKHLIIEISYIAKILTFYKILKREGIETKEQLIEMIKFIAEIKSFRHHIMEFLQMFHENESSATIYYLASNIQNKVHATFDTTSLITNIPKDYNREPCSERQPLKKQDTQTSDATIQSLRSCVDANHRKLVKNSILLTAFIVDCFQKPAIACNAYSFNDATSRLRMKISPSRFFFERIYRAKCHQQKFDNAFFNSIIMIHFFKTTDTMNSVNDSGTLYSDKFNIDRLSDSFIIRYNLPRRKRMLLLRELVLYSMGEEFE